MWDFGGGGHVVKMASKGGCPNKKEKGGGGLRNTEMNKRQRGFLQIDEKFSCLLTKYNVGRSPRDSRLGNS